jgi:hypothetical protein
LRARRSSLAVLALVALAAVAPAAAQAKLPATGQRYLTPNVGVGGVDLGDRIAAAKAAWGRGGDCTAFNCTYNEPGRPELGNAKFSYEDGVRGRVTEIQIATGIRDGKPNFRTSLTRFVGARGIKLGSTMRAVKAAYPRARPIRGYEDFYLRFVDSRRNQTVFSFMNGRLWSVLIQDARPRG